MPAVLDDISAEILDLKKKIGATILAHYYQEGEIQAFADVTGDSLKLAREATKVDSPVIVFCGVLFMAETAKMLNPSKKVLLPDLQAGCSLVDACPADKLAAFQERLRINGRKFQTVTYINSSAKVKALSDWVVTSGNALEVVRDRVPADQEILFVPDKHLGAYLQEVTGRKMILWDGSCMVHEIFSLGDLLKMKKQHPTGEDDRPPGMPRQHPRTRGLRRRDGGDGQARGDVRGADRVPGGDRGEHDVGDGAEAPAAHLSRRAGRDVLVQQVPAHGPQHAGEGPRLHARRQAGDHLAAGVRSGEGSADAKPAEPAGDARGDAPARGLSGSRWKRTGPRSSTPRPVCVYRSISGLRGARLAANQSPEGRAPEPPRRAGSGRREPGRRCRRRRRHQLVQVPLLETVSDVPSIAERYATPDAIGAESRRRSTE